MSDVTGSMGGVRSTRHASADAGLVLLYAPNHEALPPVLRLTSAPVIIGREPPDGGFTIPQTSVSRLHARASFLDGRWIISDLNSRNGVIVNGKVVPEAVLSPKDVVRIGDAIFTFVAEGASAYVHLRPGDSGTGATSELVGGVAMEKVLAQIDRIGPTEISVLVQGETGTGKELVARALHKTSRRRGALAALNCAALPANLIESELFGVKKGAFTGADRDRPGIVRAAHGGTLFLDEIGDMPLDAQAKLLRMLQTREVVPVGAALGEKVDVRVVCATHRDVQALVEAGTFRGDLFARLNGYALELPALRDRKEDLFRLVRHFTKARGHEGAGIGLRFMVAVCHYDWPYNVRELEAAVHRALVVAAGSELDSKHLPEAIQRVFADYGEKHAGGSNQHTAPPPAPSGPAVSAPSAESLREVLARHDGNVAAVARELGKDRRQIHRWLRLHGISPDGFRGGDE
jgi:sigma-54 dependent transcriptional regulator, acetoin dehydrogenase operon transcriptional activator AcoR